MEIDLRGVEIDWRGVEIDWRGVEIDWRGVEIDWRGVEIDLRGFRLQAEDHGVAVFFRLKPEATRYLHRPLFLPAEAGSHEISSQTAVFFRLKPEATRYLQRPRDIFRDSSVLPWDPVRL